MHIDFWRRKRAEKSRMHSMEWERGKKKNGENSDYSRKDEKVVKRPIAMKDEEKNPDINCKTVEKKYLQKEKIKDRKNFELVWKVEEKQWIMSAGF